MAKEAKTRTLICEFSGKTFEYQGFGRPPKYHPDHKAEATAAKRKAKIVAAKNARRIETGAPAVATA